MSNEYCGNFWREEQQGLRETQIIVQLSILFRVAPCQYSCFSVKNESFSASFQSTQWEEIVREDTTRPRSVRRAFECRLDARRKKIPVANRLLNECLIPLLPLPCATVSSTHNFPHSSSFPSSPSFVRNARHTIPSNFLFTKKNVWPLQCHESIPYAPSLHLV